MTTARDAVLWAAIEDYAALWELEWELNSLDPSPANPNRQTARDILTDLLRDGFVRLYWSQEPDGDLTVIPADQSEEILGDDKLWEPPSGWHRVVRVSATPEGESAYGGRTTSGTGGCSWRFL